MYSTRRPERLTFFRLKLSSIIFRKRDHRFHSIHERQFFTQSQVGLGVHRLLGVCRSWDRVPKVLIHNSETRKQHAGVRWQHPPANPRLGLGKCCDEGLRHQREFFDGRASQKVLCVVLEHVNLGWIYDAADFLDPGNLIPKMLRTSLEELDRCFTELGFIAFTGGPSRPESDESQDETGAFGGAEVEDLNKIREH